MLSTEKDETIRIATIFQNYPNATALWFLKSEMDGIRIQFSRIRKAITAMKIFTNPNITRSANDESFQESMTKNSSALFRDIKYLLVSLTDFSKMFSRGLLEQLPTNTELQSIHKKYEKNVFIVYHDFRNHLEHIYSDLGKVSDIGNLVDENFTFDGKCFDIGSNREKEIETIFSEILTTLEKPQTKLAKF